MTVVFVILVPLVVALLIAAANERLATQERLARVAAHSAAPAPRRSFDVARSDVSVLVAACAAGWLVARAFGLVLAIGACVGARRIRARRASRVSPIVVQERTADAIGALAAAVRSGASLAQAIRYAARESAPPASDDLEHVVRALDTGVALDEALASWGDRRPSADTDLLIGALELHRTSGGDLPAVLDQVAATIRERVGIAREVRSLTAQARLSAWILGLLPIGFFAFLWVTSRHDIEGALTTPVGLICVGVGLALEGGAFLWIRSLLEVG
jgi:Flp pilus assembly protein TadB